MLFDLENEAPVKVMRHKSVVDDTQSNQGYLLMQNGGRSRYVENTFWASVDVEVAGPHPTVISDC